MNNHAITSASQFAGPRLRTWFVGVFVLAAVVGEVGRAQEAADSAKPPVVSKGDAESKKPPDDNPPPAGPATGRIQYVGPDTYILLDPRAGPNPMPGMTYEDFLAAWKKLNQTKTTDNQPGYAIESITFNGKVIGQRAELQCQATVRLLADGPAEIPLGLVGAILQGEPHSDQSQAGRQGRATAEAAAGQKRRRSSI